MGMLIAMVVIICYQVVMRELVSAPSWLLDSLRFITQPIPILMHEIGRIPSWSEEIARLLLLWFGILSIPIGVKLHLHIGIEYIFKKFSNRVQWIVSRCIYGLIAAFGFVMITAGIELVERMSRSTLPATKLPSAVKYVVIPLAGLTLIYNAFELFFVSYPNFLKQPDPLEGEGQHI
jgi:TRAP-type C4-dicarboxylate transport system permease small subunit